MFGNTSTIGYTESLNYNKDVNLKKESFIESLVKEQWEKDKDQIINGYKNGPASTQHGVNAEYFHTGIKNAEEIRIAKIEGRDPVLIEKSPFVNGPDDLIQGDKVLQMKYYRDTNGSLNGCIEHVEKYKVSYSNNDKAIYIIPSEQYNQLLDIKKGNIPEGMSGYQAKCLREKIKRFEEAKGGSIEMVMEPGALTYEEAQLKNIELKTNETEEINHKKHKEEVEKIEESVKPSVAGAIKAACYAAGAAGVISMAMHIYNDFQNGKNIFNGDYEKEDYKELLSIGGTTALKAGAGSTLFYAVSAAVKQKVAAASFIANMIKGIAPLKLALLRGEISFKEFTNLSLSLAMATAVDALGEAGISVITSLVFTAIAGTGIALPGIVSLIGGLVISIVGGVLFTKLLDVCKDIFSRDYIELKAAHDAFIAKVDAAFTRNMVRLKNEFAVFSADVVAMDNVNNDYAVRVEACNRLSEKYGTNKLDANESIDSIKARFKRK